MLRRFSTVAAAAAMLGLTALPAAAANAQAAHPSKGSFNVPAATSSIKAWGTYQFTTFHKANVVKVTICDQLKGSAFFVIAEAEGYTSSGKVSGLVAAAAGQETPGHKSCGTQYLHGTAHLKVFSEVFASAGKLTKKTSLKSIY
jgi:hypothetical protein